MDNKERDALERVALQKLIQKTQSVAQNCQKLLNEPESKAYQQAVRGLLLEATTDLDKIFPTK